MTPVFLNARHLAERLDVRYETVLTWARRGKIPAVRDGRGRLLFNLDSVFGSLQNAPPRSATEAEPGEGVGR